VVEPSLFLSACLKTQNRAVAADVRRLHYLGFCATLRSEVRASSRRLLLFKHALCALASLRDTSPSPPFRVPCFSWLSLPFSFAPFGRGVVGGRHERDDFARAVYEAAADFWKTCRDVMTGEAAMKKGLERYLRRLARATDEDFSEP
jgi:hypothetical protein